MIAVKWVLIGRRRDGRYAWDTSSYCQRWQLQLVISGFVDRGYRTAGVLGSLTGTAYLVWYLRAMGAKIGKDCALYPGGKAGLMSEPDLVRVRFLCLSVVDGRSEVQTTARRQCFSGRLFCGSTHKLTGGLFSEQFRHRHGVSSSVRMFTFAYTIASSCAMRPGSRLLSGASMEDNSMLCEHTLLASGDVADSGTVYSGWPAKQLSSSTRSRRTKTFRRA
jgi:hypothetical protein